MSKKTTHTVTSRSAAYKMGMDAFRKEFEQSLRRLKLDVIDFYGFHSVNQPPEMKQVMGASLDFLRQQKEKGTIKHIAITGHNPVTLISAPMTFPRRSG